VRWFHHRGASAAAAAPWERARPITPQRTVIGRAAEAQGLAEGVLRKGSFRSAESGRKKRKTKQQFF